FGFRPGVATSGIALWDLRRCRRQRPMFEYLIAIEHRLAKNWLWLLRVGVNFVKMPRYKHSVRVGRINLTFLRASWINPTLTPKLCISRWFFDDPGRKSATAQLPKKAEQIGPYRKQFAVRDSVANLATSLAFIAPTGLLNVVDQRRQS